MGTRGMSAAAPLLALLCLSSLVSAQGNENVAYQPDIVGVGRMFLVALKVPAGAPEMKVTYPDSVTMFDRTPLPCKSELRKYYFRAIKATKQAAIRFAHPAGEISIPVEVWSFEDLRGFRELKGVQLPRRWPLGEALPETKQGQTIATEAAKSTVKSEDAPGHRWLEMSDEDIWRLQPDSTIPRYYWVNLPKGCPIHGADIYRKVAFYPWGKDTSFPYSWKIKCPVGDEEYPSNDFANGDMTSGEFVDDGMGRGCNYKGNNYGFIAVICRAYCHKMMSVAPQCVAGYMASGDIRYVHKALVAMSRLAVEYAYLATMTQHRHRGGRAANIPELGPMKFGDGPFHGGQSCLTVMSGQSGSQGRYSEAYDRIWPAIEEDDQIVPFLQSKGLDVKTHDDVKRFIEENLFAVWIQATLDGAIMTNGTGDQKAVARMAEMLNYERGAEFMDWLYDGRGAMRTYVPNTFFRDGAPYESTGGYNAWHLVGLGPIVESVEHLRRMRPEVYPDDKYPNFTKSRRYHNIFDFSMNTVTIDRTYPKIGDDGGINPYPLYRKLPKRAWQNGGADAFEHAYKVFKDPKFAWALANTPSWRPSANFGYTREQIEEEAAKWPDDWNDASCLQDGYGLAMLRSGKGEDKRALWMHYGHARGHTQEDIMQIGLDAHQSQILSNFGYPRNWNHWTTSWATHNVARQIPFVTMAATPRLFADVGPLHLCEAYAQGFTGSPEGGYRVLSDDWQRRMLAMVDVSDDQFYCLDLYRISGGQEHWWSFHAQEGDFTTDGLKLTAQKGGTLAGPEVEYGDEKWLEANGCRYSKSGRVGWHGLMFPFAHLYNVTRDESGKDGEARAPWYADWALKDADGLHFRLTVPAADNTEVILCDGKSPAAPSPYEMKWILLHNESESPTQTQVLAAMELYRGEPLIKGIRPLAVSGEEEAGFKATGAVVALADATDTVFASADGSVERVAAGGFQFAGRFGMYRERDGVPTDIILVGGTKLTKNGFGIAQADAEYRSPIVAIDRKTDTITVAQASDNPAALVGAHVHITNPVRRIAGKVLKAKKSGDGAELQLEFDARIGMGKVSGIDGHKVVTPTPFTLQGYRYYHGARIVNASGTAEYQLARIRSRGFALIDAAMHPELAAERLGAEFPTGSWFNVYDYGVGDEVVWPNTVRVSLVGDNTYRVSATGKVTVTMPKNAKVQ